MSIDDPRYVPPVLDPSLAWDDIPSVDVAVRAAYRVNFTPRSMPTVRPSAAEAEAVEIFEAALRTDEHTARLDNVGRVFRGER